jgi:hypothetical protein
MSVTAYQPISNIRYTESLNLYADEGALHIEIMAKDIETRSQEVEMLHHITLDPFQAYLLHQTLMEWAVKYHVAAYNLSRERTIGQVVEHEA